MGFKRLATSKIDDSAIWKSVNIKYMRHFSTESQLIIYSVVKSIG